MIILDENIPESQWQLLRSENRDLAWPGYNAAVKDANAIYSTRSHLTHEGSVSKEELTDALAKARNLVRAVMIAVLRDPSLTHAGAKRTE